MRQCRKKFRNHGELVLILIQFDDHRLELRHLGQDLRSKRAVHLDVRELVVGYDNCTTRVYVDVRTTAHELIDLMCAKINVARNSEPRLVVVAISAIDPTDS